MMTKLEQDTLDNAVLDAIKAGKRQLCELQERVVVPESAFLGNGFRRDLRRVLDKSLQRLRKQKLIRYISQSKGWEIVQLSMDDALKIFDKTERESLPEDA